MVNWVLFLAVLMFPCYFAGIQLRDVVRAARRGELRCPVRRSKRSEMGFAD